MRIALCFAMLLSFSCTAFAAAVPEQAVREAQRSIDAQDADRFEQFVDVDRILNAAAALLMTEAGKQGGNLPPALALMLSTIKDSQALASLRNLIIQETRTFVRYGITSGNFAGKHGSGIRPGGILAPLFGDASMGRKELRLAGPSVPDGQEQALLPVELKDYGNGNVYPLLLRLQWHSPDWRIMEIVNLPDIWKRIQSEAAM